jgi:tRNA threonylcarbamoyladenosine biosynthesis protein TsaE
MSIALDLPDEAATAHVGAQLAHTISPPLLIGLSGDLGAGKTTLSRALINALRPGTRVKSPTYTLVESYAMPWGVLHHLDLYRINDAEELTALGLDELLADDAIVLVEWPEKGRSVLPMVDLMITLEHRDHGRDLRLAAQSERGGQALAKVQQVLSIEGDCRDLSC